MIVTGDGMTYRRYSAVLVLAVLAVLGVAGCAKDNGQHEAPAASPAPPVSPPAAADNGSLVKLSDLVEYTISMPAPKGAPPGGIWSEAMAGEDGREYVNYLDKNGKGYVSVDFIDCRMPAVQAVKDKPGEQGEFAECFKKPTRTLKGYPMILPDDPTFAYRALVVNHVLVGVGVSQSFENMFKAADVEEFIGILDLDTLAKL
jgi:hypothetical protein